MKVLHIGFKGNIESYAAGHPLLKEMEIIDLPGDLMTEEYLAAASDAEYIVVDAISPVSRDLIEGMPNLKMIHSEGVAYNRIDAAAASEHGVLVCNSKGMNAGAVAEQAVLLMVGMLRDIVNGDNAVREGRQIQVKGGYIQTGSLKELGDCSVGLVGYGDIAEKTAVLLKAYGVNEILYYKRNPLSNEQEEKLGLTYATLDELLSKSDIVSLHLPVTEDTISIASDGFFAKMKDGAYLVNTARGELVDDEALIRALTSGKLAMAGLDTIDHEPVQKDHILLNLPEDVARRIIFSPHIGGITRSSFKKGFEMALDDIGTVEKGERPRRTVN